MLQKLADQQRSSRKYNYCFSCLLLQIDLLETNLVSVFTNIFRWNHEPRSLK